MEPKGRPRKYDGDPHTRVHLTTQLTVDRQIGCCVQPGPELYKEVGRDRGGGDGKESAGEGEDRSEDVVAGEQYGDPVYWRGGESE